jgi:hypothetical protein
MLVKSLPVKPCTAAIVKRSDRVSLIVDEVEVPPIMYALTDCPGGRWSWEERPRWNIRLFSKSGVDLFQLDLWLCDLWLPDGEMDIALAQRQIAGLIEEAPSARAMIRLNVSSPPWWNEMNIDECVTYADGPTDYAPVRGQSRHLEGDLDRSLRHSFASKKWKAETSAAVSRLLADLSTKPEGDAIFGIQVGDGVNGEYHHWGFLNHEPDISAPMSHAFRAYLRDTYDSDGELQVAWGDAAATIDGAAVPGMAERQAAADGAHLSLPAGQRLVDYRKTQHRVLAESAIHFCQLVSDVWPRPIVSGIFYGYVFNGFGRLPAGGHLELNRVLESPHVDFLAAPMTYRSTARELCGSGHSRGLVESVFRAGKLWLDEMDQSTSLGSDSVRRFSSNLYEDRSIILRNCLQAFVRGAGQWFYDFGPWNSAGWWDRPELSAEVSEISKLYWTRVAAPVDEPAADVAIVIDPSGAYYSSGDPDLDSLSEALVDGQVEALLKTGLSAHMLQSSDLRGFPPGRYRLLVLAYLPVLTPEVEDAIRLHVDAGSKLLVCYLPGLFNGPRPSSEAAARLTGLPLSLSTDGDAPEIETAQSRDPQAPQELSVRMASVRPFATPDGQQHEQLMPVQGPTGVWYSPLPILVPEQFKAPARDAECTFYVDSPDVVYTGRRLIVVHAAETGTKRIFVPGLGNRISLEMEKGSTVAVDSGDGTIVHAAMRPSNQAEEMPS